MHYSWWLPQTDFCSAFHSDLSTSPQSREEDCNALLKEFADILVDPGDLGNSVRLATMMGHWCRSTSILTPSTLLATHPTVFCWHGGQILKPSYAEKYGRTRNYKTGRWWSVWMVSSCGRGPKTVGHCLTKCFTRHINPRHRALQQYR